MLEFRESVVCVVTDRRSDRVVHILPMIDARSLSPDLSLSHVITVIALSVSLALLKIEDKFNT